MLDLKEPKEIEVLGKVFTISKFFSVEGREIVTKYMQTGSLQLNDSVTAAVYTANYSVNEEMMLKLMCHVAVSLPSGALLRLTNRTLVNNHTASWGMLVQIEKRMIEYNSDFLPEGLL